MKCQCLFTIPAVEGAYSHQGHRMMAGGRKKFPAQVAFTRASLFSDRNDEAKLPSFSISGHQDKIVLSLYRGKLVFSGEHGLPGQYILKPIPSMPGLPFVKDVPANEHLCMHISDRLFGHKTASSCLITMADGEPAYITKRFDYNEKGEKYAQEDFCQFLNRSPDSHGKNYKYDVTYEEIMRAISHVSSAPLLDKIELLKYIVFSYAIGNGDAHAKNFSVMSDGNEVMLTPSYDVLQTQLHFPSEDRMALDLFSNGYETEGYKTNGFLTGTCFREFAKKHRIPQHVYEEVITNPVRLKDQLKQYVDASFLSHEAKIPFMKNVNDRIKALSQ
ncbi:MAG: HipA domain-containing protein [Verrucomicrobiota bacterium]